MGRAKLDPIANNINQHYDILKSSARKINGNLHDTSSTSREEFLDCKAVAAKSSLTFCSFFFFGE